MPFLLNAYLNSCFRQGFLIQNWEFDDLLSELVSRQTFLSAICIIFPSPFFFFFILHAAFQDNQFYLLICLVLRCFMQNSVKSHFCVGEILSRCRCGPSVKCVVYIGQRGTKRRKIVLFAFFLGGGDRGSMEGESYCCSWGWKAWVWARFIPNTW